MNDKMTPEQALQRMTIKLLEAEERLQNSVSLKAFEEMSKKVLDRVSSEQYGIVRVLLDETARRRA